MSEEYYVELAGQLFQYKNGVLQQVSGGKDEEEPQRDDSQTKGQGLSISHAKAEGGGAGLAGSDVHGTRNYARSRL